ncbi:MAG: TIGR00159 family protein [Gemmatimonadetes bacterium]|nr:TIGR00159 family protein [Gemmatimonadota bacterium]
MPLEHFRFLIPGWRDLIEILIVSVVIYRLLLFLAGTRALQILIGLVVLILAYFGALALNFNMIATLLGVVFTYGAFAAIVVFQPELRHALARLGQSRAVSFFASTSKATIAEEIAEAVERLARTGTGAIIALERDVALHDFVESGTEMRAAVSADLLATIFTPYSPLHDGAVIVREDQIIAAGCVLPLTQFPVADKSLGTRHRAALGLTEETDAVVVVVSEETSTISVASRGLLQRGLTPAEVREVLAGRRSSLAVADASERVAAS